MVQDPSDPPPPARSVSDLIQGTAPGRATRGRTIQRVSQGGMGQADADFDSLQPTDVVPITTVYGAGRTGLLAGGWRVTVRPGSTDGRPTLEIRNVANGRGYEVRYD